MPKLRNTIIPKYFSKVMVPGFWLRYFEKYTATPACKMTKIDAPKQNRAAFFKPYLKLILHAFMLSIPGGVIAINAMKNAIKKVLIN